MIVPKNKILARVGQRFEDVVSEVTVKSTGEKVKIYQPIHDDKENKVREWAEVAVTCANLFTKGDYDKLNSHEPMLQKGDKIYTKYLSWIDDEGAVLVDGERLRPVEYRDVICVVRDGAIIPVGNWVLFSPVKGTKKVLNYEEEFTYDDRARLEYVSDKVTADLGLEVGRVYLTATVNGPGGKIGALYEANIEGQMYLCTPDPYGDILMELPEIEEAKKAQVE